MLAVVSTRRSQTGVLLVTLGFALLYTTFIARTTFTYQGGLVGTLFDDSLISLRYADNLASGHGLVWNRGETPRVEGYSNLGWTLVMSVVMLLFSKAHAPIVVGAIAAVTLLACGSAVRRILRIAGSSMAIQLAGMAIVLAYYPLVFWTLRGMEVGLLALLVLSAAEIALRPPPIDGHAARREVATLSWLAGLGFLTRNDSLVLFVVIFAYALRDRGVRRHALVAAVPLALCVLGQLTFRYAYYGELVPNTYVLKMTGVPLLQRLSRGLDAFADTLAPLAWLASIAAAAAVSTTTPRPVRRPLALGLGLAAVQSCYLIWIGGDAWAFDHSNRFVAAGVPLLMAGVVAAAPECVRFFESAPAGAVFIALNIVGLETLWLFPVFDAPSNRMLRFGWLVAAIFAAIAILTGRRSAQRQKHLCTVGAVVATIVISSADGWRHWATENATYVPNDIGAARLGLELRDSLPGDAVIAAAWLGAPAYFSGLRSIDLFGKTDKHVARVLPGLPFRPGHNKMDLAYSVGTLRPDVVFLLDGADVESYGYVRVDDGTYVRRDSTTIAAGDWNPLRGR